MRSNKVRHALKQPIAAIAALVGCLIAAAWAWTAAIADLSDFQSALLAVATWSLRLTLGWLLVQAALTLIDLRRNSDLARRSGCPEWWRNLVVIGCTGLGVALIAAPAGADPGDQISLTGLPLPDRILDPQSPVAAPPAPRRTTVAKSTYLVRPGVSLWQIAADRVPSGDPAKIAALSRALYRWNRAAIGPNPDLIHPGMHLRLTPQESR